MSDDCVFCKIVNGKLNADKVYESEAVLAFKDIHPQAPVHVIVIPKLHFAGLDEAVEQVDMLGKLQATVPTIAQTLGIDSGYKVNMNAGTFQEVPHLHYHLLGGWKNGKGG